MQITLHRLVHRIRVIILEALKNCVHDDHHMTIDIPLPLVNKFENIATNIATDGNIQIIQ